MRRLIIFLVRKKLGLKRNQQFKFTNQKTSARYYFTKTEVIKVEYGGHHPSSVSLNWLLSDKCKIFKFK